MGRTVSSAPGFAPNDSRFDPILDDFVSKERNYVHFDLPLKQEMRETFTVSKHDIERHSFWPLLGFKKIERRVKKDGVENPTYKIKSREIKFGSHTDAAILEHYCKNLSEKYEKYISGSAISSAVLAYRSGVGDNITQSKELFAEIRHRKDVIAIALDIEKFFDRIPHAVIYENLKTVLEVTKLELADFKIYKRMTQFEWVDSEMLKKLLGGRYRVGGRLCTAYDFRNLVRKKGSSLIQNNPKTYGIPQGTPLSGLYANLAMLEFDRKAIAHLQAIGASYRRYSDDIAIVCPNGVNVDDIIKTIGNLLSEIGLVISEDKTDISYFSSKNSVLISDKAFQYLGFTFDGSQILIRQSSLNRYYAKMSSGIKAKIRAAKVKGIAQDEVYMRELFRKFTHFGQYRNFPRYAYRASKVMEAPEIRKQIRNHFSYFQSRVEYYLERAYG